MDLTFTSRFHGELLDCTWKKINERLNGDNLLGMLLKDNKDESTESFFHTLSFHVNLYAILNKNICFIATTLRLS